MHVEKKPSIGLFSWLPGTSAPPAKQKITLHDLGKQFQSYFRGNWDIVAFQVMTFVAGATSFPGFGIAMFTGVGIGLAAQLTLSLEERKDFRLSRCQLLALTVLQLLLSIVNSLVNSRGIPAPLFRQFSPWAAGLTAGLGGVLSPRR